VFVGRSAFPDKDCFFVGQNIPENLFESAVAGLRDGMRPDFFWWQKHLALENAPLWPGSSARRISLGAEESSLAWRSACIETAAEIGLTVYGDPGWKDILPPEADLLPPVDYYHTLASVYANAPFSLTAMSFLLSHEVSQRHFDIWATGGFAILDNTPCLDMFAPELTEPVTFKKTGDIPDIVKRFTNDPGEKTRLAATWRETVLEEHTYGHRIHTVLQTVFA
jgi:hypothetical protein